MTPIENDKPITGKPHILLLSGSTRRQSYNTRLARHMALAVEQAGGVATLISLADYSMAIYHGDDEAQFGLPDAARQLRTLFKSHHGVFFASPEENSSISALLKNTLDWVSRADGDEPGKVPYIGKVAAIGGATTGPSGTRLGLLHLRTVLSGLGMLVLPSVMAIPFAANAFDEAGLLQSEEQRSAAEALALSLVRTASAVGVTS
ncbi:NADPH-dependent FMN reductase [Advenella sp. FME57]|nr:NAD(P)H-dependent oxidoreductase [Advenella sp. FME57]